MATKSDKLAKEIEQIRGDVQRLRDDIKVRLHLGAMDARDAFSNIEHDLDHVGREITQATRHSLENARNELKKLIASFKAPEQGKHA
ncbi:MAG TPA: hypothetical protein VF334_03885 [Polyangia bacterium]